MLGTAVLLIFWASYISASTHFVCDSSSSIPIDWKCDGMIDCADMTDERGCVNSTCVSDERLIYENWKCDGVPDCNDGSDEWNCEGATGFEMWICSDGWDQIPSDWKCDGFPDCVDRSDENNCGERVTLGNPFGEDAFTCADGKQQIPWEWECDGVVECDDGSDEDCGGNDFFTCTSDGQAIPIDWECDYAPDCNDGSDEHSDCPPKPITKFKCLTGNQEIEFNWVCDGTLDCRDGSDERDGNGCTSSNAFHCNNGDFIPFRYKCDGVTDCWDGTDEEGCPRFPLPKEIENEFRIGVAQFIRFLNRLQRTRNNRRSIKFYQPLLKAGMVRSIKAFMRAQNLTEIHNEQIQTMLQKNIDDAHIIGNRTFQVSKKLAGIEEKVKGAQKNVKTSQESVDTLENQMRTASRNIQKAKAKCHTSCDIAIQILSFGISCEACKSWHSIKVVVRGHLKTVIDAALKLKEAEESLDDYKNQLSELKNIEAELKSEYNEKTVTAKELNATAHQLAKASVGVKEVLQFVSITNSRSGTVDSEMKYEVVSLDQFTIKLTAVVENLQSDTELYRRLTSFNVEELKDKLDIVNEIAKDGDSDCDFIAGCQDFSLE